jgi:hypothetical protein|tara:strand:- start:461 stop:2353 length:1893 start_codon:yes stop_codon:yes gene_type:complete
LGNHYSTEESEILQSVGQGDFIIDRVYAAVDKLKSLLTSRNPKFSAVAREDSDYKLANVWRTILEYVWDVSNCNTHFKQVVHDYAVTGLGYFYVFVDPESDYGRGDVKITSINPFRVYVDPASRDRHYADAAHILLSTILTKEQILGLYPKLEEIIDNIDSSTDEEDYPSSTKKNSSSSFTPDVVKDYDRGGYEKYRIVERFEKIKVPYYRLFNKETQEEKIVELEAFEKILSENSHLIESGLVEAVEVLQTRIRHVATVGQVLLYEQVLNTDVYPIIPVPNIWTNTPYPKSDVTKVKDSQRLINKLFSLTLSHAQASAGLKLLVPEGSVDDVGQLERDWANPNAVIEYNPEFGEPHYPAPQPLASEFYGLISRVETYIDLNFGISELMQGFKSGAAETARGTYLLQEMGETRGRSKLKDIEGSLDVLGKVVYNFSKGHYGFKKTFRIVQANNDLTEFTINNKMYDDKTNELMSIENDISLGQHDIRIVSGSTLPSNRMAEYNMYLDAYKLGLVDDVEVLKKTNIYDKEGVLQRKGAMSQMQSYIGQLEEEVKKLRGDLQTSEREMISARKQTITQKFKSGLDSVLSEVKDKERKNLNKLENVIDKADLQAKYGKKQEQGIQGAKEGVEG